MARISLSVRDSDLSEIDAEAAGNRTSFMVTAALERARRLRRERVDREIEETIRADADMHAREYAAWTGQG
jgi:uncharacterized protein (DUF1778 family)